MNGLILLEHTMTIYSFVETSRLKPFSKYTLIVALAAAFSIQAEEKIPDECKVGGFAIGCIVYTFDHANLFDSLEMTAQTGARVVELAAKPSLSKEDPKVPFAGMLPCLKFPSVSALSADTAWPRIGDSK